MSEHGLGQAWDEADFNKVFDLFEEDDPAEGEGDKNAGGLDRAEFTKLVKRIA